jgi:hypothetical protein
MLVAYWIAKYQRAGGRPENGLLLDCLLGRPVEATVCRLLGGAACDFEHRVDDIHGARKLNDAEHERKENYHNHRELD